jgi:hypothetical protein
MPSRTAHLSLITLATAIAAIACASAAQAGIGNANFAGSKSVMTRPTPMPPRVQPQIHRIEPRIKLNCYHTRERNELGVYVHRTHCG